jgi:hypothetical protein
MNYLVEYLERSGQEELDALLALPHSAREREVLSHLVARPGLERNSVLQELGLSGSHFDKLCSSILTRVYAHVSGGDIIRLFDVLKLKTLYAHLEHEFKKEEKRLAKHGESAAAFYFDTIRHLALYTYEKRYVQLLERAMTGYLALIDTPAALAIVETICLQITAHTTYSTGISEDERTAARQAVIAHRENAFATKDPIARMYQLNAEAHVHLLQTEGAEAAKLLLEVLALVDSQPKRFLVLDRTRTLAQLAEAHYYDDKLEEARTRYEDLFRSAAIDIPPPHYHAVKYAQILTAFERYSEAEELLKHWFPRSSFKSNDRRSSAGAVNFAKLYLAWGRLDDSKLYTDLGFDANVRAEIVLYEVQLRIFELLRLFALGEYLTASDLMDNLIRYCREKNIVPSANVLPPFIAATKLLVRSRVDLESEMKEFDRLTLECMPSHNRHVAVMLRNLRERDQARKR